MRRLPALRRLPFFARRLWRDAVNPLRYAAETEDVHGPRLGRYYLLFDEAVLKGGGSQDFHFDDQGIPLIPTYVDVEPRRMHYYPIAIGQYALAIFHSWLAGGQEGDRRRFLRLAEWFVANQAADGCWYAQSEIKVYRLRPPWASAMAQGRGLSVLLRAWQASGEGRYLESARRALPAFARPLAEGGVASTFDGRVTFEEYPVEPPPHVLNGMIFALFGLWDMARACPEEQAGALFAEGAATVEALLPRYDTGWWSLYDLYHLEAGTPRNLCTTHYHDIHIKQLTVLHAITGRETLAAFARRWAAYERGVSGRLRAYAGKAAFVVRRRLR